jgi:hypothetical protein
VSASPDQPERPAIEQWLDLVLYAPLGLAIEAQKIGPSLVKAGRDRFETRVMVAKMIGQFAVAKGRMELNKRISPPPPPPVRPAPAAPAAAAGAVPAKSAATASKAPKPPAEASLALEGYDALAASQIVSRLGALTASQLDAIEAYETAHRGRRTVLAKIAQLRAAR